MRPNNRSSSWRPSRPRREIPTNSKKYEKEFLSEIDPSVSYLMSATMQMLVPISNTEDLRRLKISNTVLYDQIIQIGTLIATEVIIPIITRGYTSTSPISQQNIQKFKGYCIEATQLVSKQVAIEQIGELNLQILQNVKERVKKQQRLSRKSIINANKLIDVLSDYFQNITVLIRNRKIALEKALDETDKEDLMLSLYGTLLAFMCFSVILGVKKLKDDEHFSAIVESGLEFATELEGYTDTLDILTNPDELELLRKAESESK